MMTRKCYTREQRAQIDAGGARQEADQGIKEINAKWPRLFAAVHAEMSVGTDPADPKAQALAQK